MDMLSKVKTGCSGTGAPPWAGPAMVRRSEGCSRGDKGFSTHLLGVLSMAAGATAGGAVGGTAGRTAGSCLGGTAGGASGDAVEPARNRGSTGRRR